jgi:hypothetical protein
MKYDRKIGPYHAHPLSLPLNVFPVIGHVKSEALLKVKHLFFRIFHEDNGNIIAAVVQKISGNGA